MALLSDILQHPPLLFVFSMHPEHTPPGGTISTCTWRCVTTSIILPRVAELSWQRCERILGVVASPVQDAT